MDTDNKQDFQGWPVQLGLKLSSMTAIRLLVYIKWSGGDVSEPVILELRLEWWGAESSKRDVLSRKSSKHAGTCSRHRKSVQRRRVKDWWEMRSEKYVGTNQIEPCGPWHRFHSQWHGRPLEEIKQWRDLIYIFEQPLLQCENRLQVAGMKARKLIGRID